jgi:hypothetical protein
MAKLSSYSSLGTAPADTDSVPITSGGATKNVPVGLLVRKPFITVGPTSSYADYICDGVADDVEINAALVLGKEVYIYPGTYTIASTILIPSNTSLRGAGYATIIKMGNSLNTRGITNTDISGGNTNIKICNLKLDGNKANQTSNIDASGIKFTKVSHTIVESVWVDSTEGHGIWFSTLETSSYEGNKESNCLVTNAGSAAGNTFGSAFAFSSAENIELINCHAYDSAKAGFRTSGSVKLSNCVAKRCGNGGIVPVSGDGNKITIVGGEFSDCTGTSSDGIRMVGVNDITITGTICSGNDGSGILVVNGTKNVTITGVICKNNGKNASAPSTIEGRDGITILNSGTSVSDVTLQGNQCYDDQATATQDYGINLKNTCTNIIVIGNNCGTNQTGTSSVTTSGTIIKPASSNIGI